MCIWPAGLENGGGLAHMGSVIALNLGIYEAQYQRIPTLILLSV